MNNVAALRSEPSAWQLAIYGATILPLTLGQQPLLFMTPYYSAVFGLSLPVLGMWLTAGRIFDIFADLSVAYLSDRYRARLGRRLWVLVGLSLFLPAVWFLFVPGDGMTVSRYAVALFLFFLTWTTAFIPYLVHGTELASGHAKRAAINVLQGVGNSAALVVSYAGPLLFASAMFEPVRSGLANIFGAFGWRWLDGVAAILRQDAGSGVQSYGLVMLVIVLIMTVITPVLLLGYARWVPDRAAAGAHDKSSPFAAFRNPVFLRFAMGFLLVVSAYFITLYLLPFLLSFIYREPGELLNLLLVMTVTQIAIAPAWYFMLARWERRTCMCAAAGVQAFSLLLFALTPPHNVAMLYLDYFAFGLSGQTLMMLPFLVASDSADYSRWKTHQDSRAVHISLISLLIKAGGVSGALFVSLVGLARLDPSQSVQSPSALLALQGLGLWLPLGMLLLGAALIWTHPITRNRQAALQRRIDRRMIVTPHLTTCNIGQDG